MPDALKKMYGPLPLWGWLVVVLGGLGIAYWSTKKSGSSSSADTVSDETVPSGAFTSADQVTTGSITGSATDTDTDVSNDTWGRNAENELLARGYDPTLVDTAIRKYLASQPLNASETAVITAALRAVGAPPSPLPPPDSGDTSGTSTGPSTNAQWLTAAVKAVHGNGHLDLTNQDWLLSYLNKKYLNYNAQQVVSSAINKVGLPPSPPADILRMYHCWDSTHPDYGSKDCAQYRKTHKRPKY